MTCLTHWMASRYEEKRRNLKAIGSPNSGQDPSMKNISLYPFKSFLKLVFVYMMFIWSRVGVLEMVLVKNSNSFQSFKNKLQVRALNCANFISWWEIFQLVYFVCASDWRYFDLWHSFLRSLFSRSSFCQFRKAKVHLHTSPVLNRIKTFSSKSALSSKFKESPKSRFSVNSY